MENKLNVKNYILALYAVLINSILEKSGNS